MVSINVPSNNNKISITTGTGNAGMSVSLQDIQSFAINKAKDWAEKMDGPIGNEGYSSKWHATQSAQSANEAEQSATNAQTVYEDLQEFAGQTLENIETETDGSISEITTAKDNAIAEIEATGIDGRANIDLANLSTTGQAKIDEKANKSLNNLDEIGQAKFDAKVNKSDMVEAPFVNKAGDTMTGDLTISKPSASILRLRNENDDRDVAPSTAAGTNYIVLSDKNNNTIAQFSNERLANGTNTAKLQAFGQGGSNAPAVRVHAYADGRQGYSFPMCTTKPTTTSSARGDLVAVVTQNYVNGTSWYRVWSDGWIEQGGRTTATSVNFLKAFSNTNYNVTFGWIRSVLNTNNAVIESSTTSGFVLISTDSGTVCWYACGY